MHELFVMISIINRRQQKRFQELYSEAGVTLGFTTLGRGTAASEILDYFGLAAVEKAVLLHIVTMDTWKTVKSGLCERTRDFSCTIRSIIIKNNCKGRGKWIS